MAKKAKAAKLADKARLVAQGIRTEAIWGPDNASVQVQAKGLSLRGLDRVLTDAADRFVRDHEEALAGLRSPRLEPAVQGGAFHAAHHRRVTAQERITAVRKAIGERSYAILRAHLVLGHGCADFTSAGAPQRLVMSLELKRLLHDLAASYDPHHRSRDRILEAAERLIEQAGRI